jgi:very-short-patch-repair endonuclease
MKNNSNNQQSSHLELKFIAIWGAVSGGIELEREQAIIPGRRYRFDFVHHRSMVAVEINGATWRKGGHSSGTGLARDYEKANLAVLHGWRVFSLSGDMLTVEWAGRIAGFIRDC